jgi:hypothetical protein
MTLVLGYTTSTISSPGPDVNNATAFGVIAAVGVPWR